MPRVPRAGRGLLTAAVAVAVALVLVAAAVVLTGPDGDPRPVPQGRPNLVVIMSDDQTLESLRIMDAMLHLVRDQGTEFTQAAVSFPNCCPSRATFLTGQYAHNHGVEDNVPPLGGFRKLRGDETLPVWLHDAGYDTAHLGKYLNTWGDGGDVEPPPGWDRWFGLIDPSTYSYYGFAVSDDGERVTYGDDPQDYSTDVLAAEAVRYIEGRAGDDRPFFLSFAPLGPHVARPEADATTLAVPVAPPRYADTYADESPPRSPSYDEADVSDKPESVLRPPLGPRDEQYLQRYYQAELGALAAVDDAVGLIVDALDRTGRLDDTVIVFTSDNGLFHGEHRIRTGKLLLYEPSIRVPLLVRGGPFVAGARIDAQVSNVDLAPTLLALAGVEPVLPPDGIDLATLVDDPDRAEGRAVLLENQADGGDVRTRGVRTTDRVYLEHADGATELYDLRADPDQLENLSGDPAAAVDEAEMVARLDALRDCAGATCHGLVG